MREVWYCPVFDQLAIWTKSKALPFFINPYTPKPKWEYIELSHCISGEDYNEDFFNYHIDAKNPRKSGFIYIGEL
jgi:hypothetical protein